MGIGRNNLYAVLAVAAAAVAYTAWTLTREPVLEFRDRAYPPGFRELVLAGESSRIDMASIVQVLPRAVAAPKPPVPELCDALFADPASPAVGDPQSGVRIAAFLDYRCPYCRTLAPILAALPAGRVRLIYKEWPILGEGSLVAARAALAADRQGKYAALHARLMDTRLVPTQRLVEDFASELGMNIDKLRQDMRSQATEAAIGRTVTLARALAFMGTPALVIGRTVAQGEISRGALERLIGDEAKHRAKVC
jgi:protein-disulfide isomerase